MGKDSKIPWTDHTFNPWHGCTKVRKACENCYAASFAKRTGHDVFGPNKPRRFLSDSHWKQPLRRDREAAREGVRPRVFCMSMGDLFETRADLAGPRQRAFDLMRRTPNLDWLILTKRIRQAAGHIRACGKWPANARLGVTVATQEDVDEDIPTLIGLADNLGCSVFVSVEPMLGPVDLTHLAPPGFPHDVFDALRGTYRVGLDAPSLDWVICGAESAPGKRLGRPIDLEWVRSLRDQCAEVEIPFMYKQGPMGGKLVELPELDGRVWAEVPT